MTLTNSSEHAKPSRLSGWIVVCAALLILAFILAVAAAYFAARATNGSPSVNAYPGNESLEVATLRVQLEEVARAQDTLVSSLLAALGIAATFIVAASALAALFFRYQYERDMASLSRVATEESTKREAAVQQIDSQIDSLTRKVNDFQMVISKLEQSIDRVALDLDRRQRRELFSNFDFLRSHGAATDAGRELAGLFLVIYGLDADEVSDSFALSKAIEYLQWYPGAGNDLEHIELIENAIRIESDRWSRVRVLPDILRAEFLRHRKRIAELMEQFYREQGQMK